MSDRSKKYEPLSDETLDGIEELLATGTSFTGDIIRSMLYEIRQARRAASPVENTGEGK